VLGGAPALTLSSPAALFHVLVLFLQARPRARASGIRQPAL